MNFSHADFETSCASVQQFPAPDRPEIVFAGRSNVGKSSLINKLLSRKSLARVSATPGKTATANFYLLDGARFVDLPGYGYARVGKGKRREWSKLIKDYFLSDRDTALVVLLIDIRHPLMQLDHEMIDMLIDYEMPFMIAFTKVDKIPKGRRGTVIDAFSGEIQQFEDIVHVVVSAETGEGIDNLQQFITEAAEG